MGDLPVGSRIVRTSYTGLRMLGTIMAYRTVGTMLYAVLRNDGEAATFLYPAAGLMLLH